MIKDVLQRLESLQAVDLKVREIEKMREVIPGKIAELLGETRGKEAELAKVEAKVAEVDRERRQLETNAIDYGARLQRLQGQQSEIKHQKEYEVLLREMDGLKKHKAHFEEEALRSMELVEQVKKLAVAATEEVEKSRAAVAGQIGELEAKMTELAATIATETVGRHTLTNGIPDDQLRLYELIRQKRGKAVVSAQNGVCQGCNRSIPPQMYNVIMRLTSIEQCPGCQRFLFFRAPEALPPG